MASNGSAPSALTTPGQLTASERGADRARVGEIQRMRLLMAMAEVVSEHGAGDASVALVVERAGVSRRTFYEVFGDRQDCFLAVLEEALGRVSKCVADCYDPRSRWADGIRSALSAVLQFLEDEPTLGRVAIVESLNGGASALALRRSVVARMVAAVDAGREGASAGSRVTTLTAEGVVGGVASVIHGRMLAGEASLLDLLNPLMSMIVLPYLGPAAARRELDRPTTEMPVRSAASVNPLKSLDMRLTYRTVRVLTAVKEHPRQSNRVIGQASGIGDQGQISKLLARLEGLGLVENAHVAYPRGAANAWALTGRGEEMANVLAARVTS